MTNAYHKLIKDLWNRNNNNKAICPKEFKEVLNKVNPLFGGLAENDSKDLVNFLIERFHQELKVVKTNSNNNNNNNNIRILNQANERLMLDSFIKEFEKDFISIISNLFYGMMEIKSQCQGSQVIQYNFQVCSFLEFPLLQVNQYFFIKRKGHY